MIQNPPTAKSTYEYHAARKRRLDLLFGLGAMGLAFVVYFATMSTGVFPGASASLMATFSGIEPRVSPALPMWGWFVSAIAKVGLAHMPWFLNFFSLVVGVLCVGLIYHISTSILFASFTPDDVSARRSVFASVIGAFTTALAFAFAVPVWMASTRLHYQCFDLLYLLVLAELVLLYIRHGWLVLLFLFGLLFGAGLAECAYFLPFLPLFLFLIFRYWFRQDRLTGGRIFGLVFFGVLGLGFYYLAARSFCAHHDITIRGFKGPWDVVYSMWRDQAHLLNHAIRRRGWLLPVFFVILPWLAVLAIAPRAFGGNRTYSFTFFHVALSLLMVAMLGNVGGSPWAENRAMGGLPVFLYAMVASSAGYLVAYYYSLIAGRLELPSDEQSSIPVRVSNWCAYGFGSIVAVAVVVIALINAFEANGRRGAFADRCAAELLTHIQGRPWLVSDGLFDNHLLIEAARRGQPLHLFALYRNDSEIYLRQLKKFIAEEESIPEKDKVHLQNTADLGVMSFIQEWIQTDPSVLDKFAVMSAPDLLVGAGYTVVPNYFCFIGAKDRDSFQKTDFLSDPPSGEGYSAFWSSMKNILAKSRSSRDPVSGYRAAVRRQVGFVANNLGVLLEDLGREEEAFSVYKEVRSIDPENISALLNQVEMLKRLEGDGFHKDERAAIEKSLEEFVRRLKGGKYPIWTLSRTFGYVRMPALFAQLGWRWALSGQPGMALAGLERAASISVTTASRTRAREAMAEILFEQNDNEKSAKIYEDILTTDPQNQRALLSLAHIASRRGTYDEAREWLAKARAAGADAASLTVESAAIDLSTGRPEDARIKLQEITQLQPRNLRAWGMLAVAVMQMKEYDEVEKNILPRMEQIAGTPDDYVILIARGQLALQKGKNHYQAARSAFERASELRPGLVMLAEWVLRLDFMMGDKAAGEVHARALLRQNRDNGIANYIMGSLMLERGYKAEAEDYLRRSVSASKSPEALNDLAELLRKTGNLEEAEKQIRAAIELSPDFYVTWDTLGGVLMDTKRLDEAEQAYLKALEIYQDDLRVHLNLAKLLYQKGDLVRAREAVNKVQPRRSELPPAEQEELADLLQKLTPKRTR